MRGVVVFDEIVSSWLNGLPVVAADGRLRHLPTESMVLAGLLLAFCLERGLRVGPP